MQRSGSLEGQTLCRVCYRAVQGNWDMLFIGQYGGGAQGFTVPSTFFWLSSLGHPLEFGYIFFLFRQLCLSCCPRKVEEGHLSADKSTICPSRRL
jgi:hypothetical protein